MQGSLKHSLIATRDAVNAYTKTWKNEVLSFIVITAT